MSTRDEWRTTVTGVQHLFAVDHQGMTATSACGREFMNPMRPPTATSKCTECLEREKRANQP